MNDYYLRFESEEEANAALGKTVTPGPAEGMERVGYAAVAGLAVDLVGVLHEPTGEVQTLEGPGGVSLSVPVLAPLPGWHVNLRGAALPQGLAPYVINPAKPRRVWA